MSLLRLTVAASLILGSFFAGIEAPLAAERQDGNQPFAVVELFTSEGCSSCPPADTFLRDITSLAREQNLRIFTLGFHVDYWDYLGWRDPYASRAFSNRQRRYAQALREQTVYTPQMIVNGMDAFGGYRRDRGQRAIDRALATPSPATLILTGVRRDRDKLKVGYQASGYGSDNVLNMALVERGLKVDVARGENAGRLLQHDNTVRRFASVRMTSESGEISIDIPGKIDLTRASIVGYIQDSGTMRVLGANVFDLRTLAP